MFVSQISEMLTSISQINDPILARHVWTLLNAFFIRIPNIVTKFQNFDIFYQICYNLDLASAHAFRAESVKREQRLRAKRYILWGYRGVSQSIWLAICLNQIAVNSSLLKTKRIYNSISTSITLTSFVSKWRLEGEVVSRFGKKVICFFFSTSQLRYYGQPSMGQPRVCMYILFGNTFTVWKEDGRAITLVEFCARRVKRMVTFKSECSMKACVNK